MSTVASVVLAIGLFLAGVLVTWVFDRRGNRERRPTYVITGNRVVLAYPKRGIEVFFRGERVPVVSRSLVVLWNDGRETIRATDVPQNAPLAICVKEPARILEATVAAATRPEIEFRTAVDEPGKVVMLSFDHLDHKDGATIEILHTGPHPWDVDLTGDVMGTQGRLRRIDSPLWDDPSGFKFFFVLAAGALAVALGSAVYREWVSAAFAAALFLLMVATGLGYRRSDRRRLPTALWRDIPGGLPFALPPRPKSRSVSK